MSDADRTDTLDVFTGLPNHSDVLFNDVQGATMDRLQKEAETLQSLGFLLVLLVPAGGMNDGRLLAYAIPDDTDRLRDAIATAEEDT